MSFLLNFLSELLSFFTSSLLFLCLQVVQSKQMMMFLWICSLSTRHCWNQASIRNCCFLVHWDRHKKGFRPLGSWVKKFGLIFRTDFSVQTSSRERSHDSRFRFRCRNQKQNRPIPKIFASAVATTTIKSVGLKKMSKISTLLAAPSFHSSPIYYLCIRDIKCL